MGKILLKVKLNLEMMLTMIVDHSMCVGVCLLTTGCPGTFRVMGQELGIIIKAIGKE